MWKRLGASLLVPLLLAVQVAGAQAQTNICLEKKNKTVSISNRQDEPATVYINFGADSALNAENLLFCEGGKARLNCQFTMDAKSSRDIPNPGKKYINMALAFNHAVACGSTKAEVIVNNPKWCDVFDVSVVDGFNEKIQINLKPPNGNEVKLGPPVGHFGNQNVFGVFPYGCDLCAGIKGPPCGNAGKEQCHAGTENNPQPICQYQMDQRDGRVEILLLPKPIRAPRDKD